MMAIWEPSPREAPDAQTVTVLYRRTRKQKWEAVATVESWAAAVALIGSGSRTGNGDWWLRTAAVTNGRLA